MSKYLILFLVFTQSCYAAVLPTRLSKERISFHDTVQLIISLEQHTKGDLNKAPLLPLFDILAEHSSQQVTYLNGRISKQRELHLTLAPKKRGHLVIPVLSCGSDTTAQLLLKVEEVLPSNAQQTSQAILIETAVSTSTPLVGSEVLYKVKIMTQQNLNLQRLSLTPFEHPDIAFFVAEDRKLDTEIRHNQIYEVQTITYVLFPSRAGELTLPPPTLQGLMARKQVARNLFGFFTDFDHKPFQVKGESLSLQVDKIPQGIAPQQWLPARELTIERTSLPSSWQVGQPVTLEVTLKATGISAHDIPELAFPEVPGISVYSDPVTIENKVHPGGIEAQKIYKITLVPEQAGDYELPALQVPWWQTTTNTAQQASLDGFSFQVAPAVAPIATSPDPALSAQPVVEYQQTTWILLGFLSISLAGNIGLYWRLRMALSSRVAMPKKKLLVHLEQACAHSETRRVVELLLLWGQQHWPDSSPQSMTDFAQKIGDEALTAQLLELDRSLYGEASISTWQGQVFWLTLKPFLLNPRRRPKSVVAPIQQLPALNPSE